MEYLSVANSCRACQDKTPNESQIFIFTSARIPDIYKDTTSLDIHENDGLPKVLCSACYNRLLEAYNFRKMCSAAVLHFQKILSMDATLLNIKTDPDDLDALNNPPRNQDLPSDREDSVSVIPDTLLTEQSLFGIIKTELDDDDIPLSSVNSPQTHIKQEESQTIKKSITPETSGNLECDICNSKFHLKTHLKMHMREKHLKLKPCEYTICEENLTISETDSKSRKWSCEHCPNKFYTKQNLKQHVKAVHERLRDLHCTKCEKSFASIAKLKIHLLGHEGVKKFKCKICGKMKATASELMSHMRSHITQKKLSCKYCPYKCNKTQCLKQHVRVVHLGIRDFHCSKCGKSFTREEHLKVHILRHEGIKNFKCTICGKETVTRSDLNKHMRCHMK